MVQPLHCSSPVKTVKFAEAEGNLILLQRVSNSQPITNHYLRISAHDWPYVLSMVPLTYSSWKKEWSMISTGYCCWSRRELYGCSASELCSNWNKSNQIAGLLKPRSFLSGKSKLLLVARLSSCSHHNFTLWPGAATLRNDEPFKMIKNLFPSFVEHFPFFCKWHSSCD